MTVIIPENLDFIAGAQTFLNGITNVLFHFQVHCGEISISCPVDDQR